VNPPPTPESKLTEYRYRLLNVFAIHGNRFSGNPLCVFENGGGMDTATMQALALQFNLSETTFVLPSKRATAAVRIFTPTFEMPFAGHPTLGTAYVVRALTGAGNQIALDMAAGIIPVAADGDTWTLQAGTPRWRSVEATHEELAVTLGLTVRDIGETPLWIDTGAEQMLIPLNSVDAVRRCEPVAARLKEHGHSGSHRHMAYVWAAEGESAVQARFFFIKGTAVVEDPATGSACANLGGWFVATGADLPMARRIHQGSAVDRPSLLGLRVDAQRRISVSGDVIELGRGVIAL
jgi:trans-2,3-dihydro-3-hydroxyanthranilate isomerase